MYTNDYHKEGRSIPELFPDRFTGWLVLAVVMIQMQESERLTQYFQFSDPQTENELIFDFMSDLKLRKKKK